MSVDNFISSYKAYFVDHELSEFDEKRLRQMFQDNGNIVIKKVVKKQVRVVEKPSTYIATKYVFVDTSNQATYEDINLVPGVDSLVNKVINNACRVWGIHPDALLSKCRKRNLVNARFFVALKLRQYNMQYSEIAKRLNLDDHSSVIHAVKTAKNLIETCHEPFVTLWKAFDNDFILEKQN